MFSEAIDKKFEARAAHLRLATQAAAADAVSHRQIASWMLGAECFFWSHEIAMGIVSVLQDRDSIADNVTQFVTMDGRPYPQCWFWFERPLTLTLFDAPGDILNLAGLFVANSPGRATKALVLPYGVDLSPLVGFSDVWLHLFVTKACQWMRDTVEVERHAIERHARKRIARAGADPNAQALHVIRLRRAESAPAGDATQRHIEYRCQFQVREHLRRLATGKIIPIQSYVKGPKDRPFKASGPTVYAVTR